jgi:hypothetical protein
MLQRGKKISAIFWHVSHRDRSRILRRPQIMNVRSDDVSAFWMAVYFGFEAFK